MAYGLGFTGLIMELQSTCHQYLRALRHFPLPRRLSYSSSSGLGKEGLVIFCQNKQSRPTWFLAPDRKLLKSSATLLSLTLSQSVASPCFVACNCRRTKVLRNTY